MQIEEALEILKEIQACNRSWLKETTEENCEKIYLRDIEAIDTVLNELEEQKEANKELNKVLIHFKAVIDAMAQAIINYDDQLVINRYRNKEEVKEVFEQYVEWKKKQ